MTLLDIRTQLVKITGRYDLVTDATTFADNGADFYIHEGQKYLDRLETIKKSYSKVYASAVAGSWYTTFEYCRAVKKVWCSNSNYVRWELKKLDYELLKLKYNQLPANMFSSSPIYYAPILYTRTQPEVESGMTIDKFFDTTTIDVSAVSATFNGIIWMPPTDAEYTIEIEGLFYSPTLLEDEDINYWTEVQPLVLIMAAARSIEISYRNTQGAKDWERSIQVEMTGVGMDLIEEEIADVDQMEG